MIVLSMYCLSVTTLSVSLKLKEKDIIDNLYELKVNKTSSGIQYSNKKMDIEHEKNNISPVIQHTQEYKDIEELAVLFNNQNSSFYKEYLSVDYLENGQANVCPEIRNYKPIIKDELSKYGLVSHTEFFMALLQKESGCFESIVNGDIAQVSESLGLEPNTIKNPNYSIQIGVEYYSNLINTYMGEDVDVRFIIHSYNFGERLIREAIEDNNDYTIAYIIEKAKIYKKDYFGDISRKDNEWRPVGAEYGDLRYVANLFSIYTK